MKHKSITKVRKRSFTLVEQASHQVRGFSTLYQQLEEKIVLAGIRIKYKMFICNFNCKLSHNNFLSCF